MKLNKRRTFLVATMFFAILMLWQIYYTYVPLYLTQLLVTRYGGVADDYFNIVGHIMSLDNLASILIIPLFGWLSDRTRTPIGRRMPYIIVGCFISLVLFPLIAVMYIFNSFVGYFVVIICLVVTMASFRSPAVALMPDITPKPLRAGANGIINFVGYLGAILGGALTIVFSFNKSANPLDNAITIVPFFITSILMMGVIVLFLKRFYELRVVDEMRAELDEGNRKSDTIHEVAEGKKLSHADKFNFGILICAVFFCWFAFNALQNFGSLYGAEVLNVGTNKWSQLTVALSVSALCTFLPAIWLSKLIGRKWSVIVGLGIVISALMGANSIHQFGTPLILLFALSGIGWAIVNVNSYPMFVELATAKNVGRFTGIYYLVSQGAMFLTSNISGYVYKYWGFVHFYDYALIFMEVAILIAFFYRTRAGIERDKQRVASIDAKKPKKEKQKKK